MIILPSRERASQQQHHGRGGSAAALHTVHGGRVGGNWGGQQYGGLRGGY